MRSLRSPAFRSKNLRGDRNGGTVPRCPRVLEPKPGRAFHRRDRRSRRSIACPAQPPIGRDMKFIFDNDFIGPGGSAINAAFLCTTLPNEDLLGFTCVAGDDRVTVGARELLRFLKLIARDDIPVLIGADRPLLNTAARMARWQEDYGKLSWIGQAIRCRSAMRQRQESRSAGMKHPRRKARPF